MCPMVRLSPIKEKSGRSPLAASRAVEATEDVIEGAVLEQDHDNVVYGVPAVKRHGDLAFVTVPRQR